MGTPPGINSPLLSPPKRSARTWALSICVSITYPLAVDLTGTRLRQLVLHEDLLRHHIRWPVFYNVLPYLLHRGIATVPERDHRVNLLPDIQVFHPKGARLAHPTRSHQKPIATVGPRCTSSPGSPGAHSWPSLFTTSISVSGMALPMQVEPRSISSGGKYVERNASVRPYIRYIFVPMGSSSRLSSSRFVCGIRPPVLAR